MLRLASVASVLALCLATHPARCQTPMERSDLGVASKIAPAWFGPNAFPVPELPSVAVRPYAEIAARWYGGFIAPGDEDTTVDIAFRAGVPLFSERVTLNMWGVVREFWSFGPQTAALRRVASEGKGSRLGDIYVSTDILALKESAVCPSLVLRAAVKTASGGDFVNARYYDSAGYFFDAAVSKSFAFGGYVSALRISATTGFLCWQTDNARQNDAAEYGLAVAVSSKAADLECFWGGYAGWEKDGDRPMVVRARLDVRTGGRLRPFVHFLRGLRDYPFTGAGIGLRLDF